MKNTLDKLSDVTNRSLGQTKFLFDLCDKDLNKLVCLEQKIANNFLGYCPNDKEEVEKILAMGNGSSWVFSDERYKELNNF